MLVGGIVDCLHDLCRNDDGIDVKPISSGLDTIHESIDFVFK